MLLLLLVEKSRDETTTSFDHNAKYVLPLRV